MSISSKRLLTLSPATSGHSTDWWMQGKLLSAELQNVGVGMSALGVLPGGL